MLYRFEKIGSIFHELMKSLQRKQDLALGDPRRSRKHSSSLRGPRYCFPVAQQKGNPFELDCTFDISSSSFSAACSIQVPDLDLGGLISIIQDGAGFVVQQAGQVVLAVERLGADLTVFTQKAYQDFANAVNAGLKICNTLLHDAEALTNGIEACGVKIEESVQQCSFTAPSFPSIDPSNLLNLVNVFASVPYVVQDLDANMNQCIAEVGAAAGQIAASISSTATCSLSSTTAQNINLS